MAINRKITALGDAMPVPMFNVLRNKVSQTPVDEIPQKRDFFQPQNPDISDLPPIQTAPIEQRQMEAVPEPMFQVSPQVSPQVPPAQVSPVVAPTAPSVTPESLPPNAYQTAQRNYQDAVTTPAQKQGLGKQILFKVFQGLAAMGGQPLDTRFLGEAKRDRQVNQAASVLAPLQQQQEFDTKQKLLNAQTSNIYADNLNQADKLKETKLANFYRQNKFFDPLKATPSQTQQLAEIGRTPASIGKYDFTDPKNRIVAGQDFQLDPTDKTWKPSGLPTDGSKSLTEFTVQDPETLETSTYTVTSDRAASFKTSITNAKLNVIAARENNNANREQQANIQNAQFDFQAQRENADAWQNYNTQNLKIALESAQTDGSVLENQEELQSILDTNLAKTSQMTDLGNELAAMPETKTDEQQKHAEEIEKRLNKLTDEINGSNDNFGKALGKTKAGQAAQKRLQDMNFPKPKMIVAPKIQAVTVGGGERSVSRGELQQIFDANKAKQGWKTIADAEKYYKARQYTIQ